MEIKIKQDNKLNYYVKLDESETIDDSKVIISGNILPINSPTVNGHIYSEDAIKDEISKFQESIKNRICYGFVNSYSGDNCLADASHLITKLDIRDSTLYAEMELLPTPMGDKLKDAINRGTRFNVGVIGMGNISEDNTVYNYNMLGVSVYGDVVPDDKI